MSNTDNKIIIVTAPSGAGKTSITKHLLQTFAQLEFSVSAATREARSNERHGKDYYFISAEEFQKKIEHNEFVEWEMVYQGKYYGTLKSELTRIWSANKIPVLDVDVQGAIHVQQQYPTSSTLSIFIEPPSIDELRNRLISRGTESDESLMTRIGKAGYELSFHNSFNFRIVNQNLEWAKKEAETIVATFINS